MTRWSGLPRRGGVGYYRHIGGDAVPHHLSEEEEQEKGVTGWLEGEGSCLVTHNQHFSGCESKPAVLITSYSGDPGLQSGLSGGWGGWSLL